MRLRDLAELKFKRNAARWPAPGTWSWPSRPRWPLDWQLEEEVARLKVAAEDKKWCLSSATVSWPRTLREASATNCYTARTGTAYVKLYHKIYVEQAKVVQCSTQTQSIWNWFSIELKGPSVNSCIRWVKHKTVSCDHMFWAKELIFGI